ncbi:hypothetical protein P171DRAFT_181384 [Karstenula rhodostoma CBS 690.94]|uniref:Uncharacterized protein n=1 Tax=Karstenula rhodostoma CBS 690.94 TaxID=1392251 RepID=A0A9P4U5R4_9PLEO|nr:hypothetical protein P171DRAFT_181384 [Karstenula rhodostoma CBS 690.94]
MGECLGRSKGLSKSVRSSVKRSVHRVARGSEGCRRARKSKSKSKSKMKQGEGKGRVRSRRVEKPALWAGALHALSRCGGRLRLRLSRSRLLSAEIGKTARGQAQGAALWPDCPPASLQTPGVLQAQPAACLAALANRAARNKPACQRRARFPHPAWPTEMMAVSTRPKPPSRLRAVLTYMACLVPFPFGLDDARAVRLSAASCPWPWGVILRPQGTFL